LKEENDMESKKEKISPKIGDSQYEMVGPAGTVAHVSDLAHPIFGTKEDLDDFVQRFKDLNGEPHGS